MQDDCEFRISWPDELNRVAILLGGVRMDLPGSWNFVAVRSRPVERIVAVASCWPTDNATRFRWRVVPRLQASSLPSRFLAALEFECQRQSIKQLQSEEMVSVDSWQATILKNAGFRTRRVNECFEARIEAWTERIKSHRERSRRRNRRAKCEFLTERLSAEHFTTALNLIKQHGLIPAEQFSSLLRAGEYRPHSTIVLGPRQEAQGIFVARQIGSCLKLDAVVVAPTDKLSRGNIYFNLLERSLESSQKSGIETIHFRADPTANPSTARTGLKFESDYRGIICNFEKEFS
jgi:hypothetical protein